MSRLTLMGVPVDKLTMDETVVLAEKSIQERKLCQHVVINAAKLVAMQEDDGLKRSVSNCDIINVDGMPLVWASRLLGTPLPGRVAGIDLFQRLVATCHLKGYRPYFFGAEQWVVQKMVDAFRVNYPALDVAGLRNGYFSPEQEFEIAEAIKKSKADMLFLGFSSPMKEKFLNRWMPEMQVPFCMGVGGSFDVVAGKTKRAPHWMQSAGLEWFYRILQEPKRMWKRYAKTNPVFLWLFLKALTQKDVAD